MEFLTKDIEKMKKYSEQKEKEEEIKKILIKCFKYIADNYKIIYSIIEDYSPKKNRLYIGQKYLCISIDIMKEYKISFLSGQWICENYPNKIKEIAEIFKNAKVEEILPDKVYMYFPDIIKYNN